LSFEDGQQDAVLRNRLTLCYFERMSAAQVLIAGAGPAGASLAYLLARRGIAVVLLERRTDFAREFRGEGLMPSGSDALAQMGLETQLAALPQVRIDAVEVYRGSKLLARLGISNELFAASGPRVVSQSAMLEMLVGEASRYSNFRLERGVTVRDLITEGGRVTGLAGYSAARPVEFCAELVVGTDGHRH
jgi:2-polyprenyl-6-methoxyphenol hydroxylase-like FAD-dependent oxidoreductase